ALLHFERQGDIWMQIAKRADGRQHHSISPKRIQLMIPPLRSISVSINAGEDRRWAGVAAYPERYISKVYLKSAITKSTDQSPNNTKCIFRAITFPGETRILWVTFDGELLTYGHNQYGRNHYWRRPDRTFAGLPVHPLRHRFRRSREKREFYEAFESDRRSGPHPRDLRAARTGPTRHRRRRNREQDPLNRRRRSAWRDAPR